MDLDKLIKRHDGKLSPWDLFIELAKDTPLLGVSIKVAEQYETRARFQRIEEYIERLSRRVRDVEKARVRFEEEGAAQTLHASAEYVWRTADDAKIDRYAAVIAGTAQSDVEWSEAEAFVHDLYRLRSDDLKVLRVLDKVNGPLVSQPGGPAGPELEEVTNEERPHTLPFNAMRNQVQKCVAAAKEEGFTEEETYVACARLSGFGLAFELTKGTMGGTWGRCFYPSTRGIVLNSLLSGKEGDGPGD